MTLGLRSVLAGLAVALDEIGESWALIGGLAVSSRIEPRFTRDVDVVVAVEDDDGAERVAFALRTRGYRVHIVLEQSHVQRLATIRFLPPGAVAEDSTALVDVRAHRAR